MARARRSPHPARSRETSRAHPSYGTRADRAPGRDRDRDRSPADPGSPGSPGSPGNAGSRDGGRSPARARRELSQNFLARRAVAERVARLVRPVPGGLLLEVGAGRGVLTEALAPYCGRLVAHEIDPRLLPALRDRFGGPHHAHVRISGGDFLAAPVPREPFALAGNIPYSRTAEIVDWALRARTLTSATFVTQLEYARKRTGDYGRWSLLTVRTWPCHEWRLLGRISRREFRPVPRVDSGILRIERRERPLLPSAALGDYHRMVELGFSGVGGSLYASLRRAHRAGPLDAAFRGARLDRSVVVAYVTPEQWLTVFRTLRPVRSRPAGR
ncbi:23S rRNA (adenine(2058)-N(6))-methyltransferase Erm(S) [Streptomyces sp. S07_1.15]|uniref:23S rRNA (adenine(2058)-N(6))-methyltransferase Erm(S) n=1 Tax=Streptomyces sp. S07_1.15 TaxID=2873925 RepID=UPI001D1586E0|nr:23S rRNA (adenine(2058)-N(6))-methyltransferase Erm(S) [Streptomyces sp. S07_1.15]MCC3651079.1 23S rRNA (adenine(2058)-N(6))-methyltransferase Erm(S) [Streptomyces sp. S07_1.15]